MLLRAILLSITLDLDLDLEKLSLPYSVDMRLGVVCYLMDEIKHNHVKGFGKDLVFHFDRYHPGFTFI